MPSRVILGTANFIRPYGILSQSNNLPPAEVYKILKQAQTYGLRGLDTALAYGDLFQAFSAKTCNGLDVINKISILEKPDVVLPILRKQGPHHYGILIHDPQNLSKVPRSQAMDLMQALKSQFPSTKLGVSAYETLEVYEFSKIYMPELIQIPLNPLNQHFNTPAFKNYVRDHAIEIHARSLFLQGVLLADTLPENLEPLTPYWKALRELAGHHSLLSALLNWAMMENWIDAWVLGVSSSSNLRDILKVLPRKNNQQNPLAKFPPVDHPLTNPKNWTFLS